MHLGNTIKSKTIDFLKFNSFLILLTALLIPNLLIANPGFFGDSHELRTFTTPTKFVEKNTPTDNPTVTVSFDINENFTKVLPTIYSYNENSVMGEELLTDESFGLKHLRNANINHLRLPGGSWSNQWLWDGINHWGDSLKENYCSTGVMSHPTHTWNYSTDQLLNMCEKINAKPQICVNFALSRYIKGEDAVEQAAHYAAQWVRDVNIEKGLGVKYWEVGNENYGSWEKGFVVEGDTITAEEYGKGFCIFADSMKAADSTIKIGAVIIGDEWCDIPDWTPTVLKEVQNHADFLAIHDYFNWKPNADDVTTSEILNGLRQIKSNKEYLQRVIEQCTEKNGNTIPIAMTEYNIFGGSKNSTLLGGLFLSRALCEFTIAEYGLANTWCMVGGGINEPADMGMLVFSENNVQQYTPRSTFYPFYYSSQYIGDEMIPTSSSNSDVSVYLSKFNSGEFGFVVTNTGANDEILELNLPDVKTLYWHSITGDSLTANTFKINGVTSESGYYGPEEYDSIPPYKCNISNTIKCSIPKFSMNYFAATNNGVSLLNNTINKKHSKLSIIINKQTIQLSSPVKSIELYQANGKVVFSQSLKKNKKSVNLDKHLTKGIYYLKATTEKGLIISKKILY